MREYLHIVVTPVRGLDFYNHLMLSEVHLVSSLAKDNSRLTIERKSITKEKFHELFG